MRFILVSLSLIISSCYSTEKGEFDKTATSPIASGKIDTLNQLPYPEINNLHPDTLWISEYDYLHKRKNSNTFDLTINGNCEKRDQFTKEDVRNISWAGTSVLCYSIHVEQGIKVGKWSYSFCGGCEFRKSRIYYGGEFKKYRMKELNIEDLYGKVISPQLVFERSKLLYGNKYQPKQ